MKAYLGKSGLERTWQEPLPEIAKCNKCGGEARIMFVAFEGIGAERKGDYVCDLRNNGGKGDYWVHDAIACAVYLCKDCFEPIAILNQA